VTIRYGSVCSGVEAATTAWHPLGWEPQWFSEIEKFPSAVLANHYPDVPNHGDITTFKEWPNERSIDLLVGGTPCQSFSVAGLRKGLDDPRGNLMLTYLAVAAQRRPRWLVWENVPGVLSSNGGRDFGTLLGALGKLGYGFAYRVLDAQYFGVAQRRRRVFVVGYLGDWRCAAAVLFERESLSGHPAPSREEGEGVAPTVTQGPPFSRTGNDRVECEAIVMAHGQAGAEISFGKSPTLTTVHEAPIVFGAQNSSSQGDSVSTEVTPTLDKSKTPAVAIHIMAAGPVSGNQGGDFVQTRSVRRLTLIECERLQGFPDNYTQIPWRNKPAEDCPDSPRYKAIGNSMAVPVMRWIGEKIDAVERIKT
tara:strand:+ start:1700 stop:2791 length:1092 start_codon:yes stop_codon:yes gene_type:complete